MHCSDKDHLCSYPCSQQARGYGDRLDVKGEEGGKEGKGEGKERGRRGKKGEGEERMERGEGDIEGKEIYRAGERERKERVEGQEGDGGIGGGGGGGGMREHVCYVQLVHKAYIHIHDIHPLT